MTKYKVEHMHKWERESDYGGDDLSHWYILVARTRDSNLLENSNYESILRDIRAKRFKEAKDSNDTGYLLASFGHWACGWIESIMIHEDSSDKLLEWADGIKAGLDDYPLYDEEDHSERELELQWHDVKEYYVVEYLSSLDDKPELTEQQIDDITRLVLNSFDFEVTGYDEVITSTPDNQIKTLIDKQLEHYRNLRHCSICGANYDAVVSACNCQIRMFAEPEA